MVSDAWQGKGLGSELLRMLVQVGRQENVRRIVGHIMAENIMMKRVSEEVGFELSFDDAKGEWKAQIEL